MNKNHSKHIIMEKYICSLSTYFSASMYLSVLSMYSSLYSLYLF